MNTKDLTIYRIPTESEAWHRFRTTGLTPEDAKQFDCQQYAGGLGASEIALPLGLQKKYRPCVQELYQIKSGSLVLDQKANRAMIRGKILEPVVFEIWQLYNGGQNDDWVQTIEEFRNGNRETRNRLAIRRGRNYRGYFVNSNFPWLFSSLDYFAEKNTAGIDGIIHEEGFPIECKTINANYAKLWVNGVPEYYVAQINQEMLCTNSTYGEIAVLFPDEFRFQVFPFNRDEQLCKQILYWGKDFWDRVVKARACKKEMDVCLTKNDINRYDELKATIDSMEPEPDDSEAFNEYIKERYREVIPSVEGSIELWKLSKRDDILLELSKKIDADRTYIQNQFMALLESSGARQIDFNAFGKITYNADKNGKRSLRKSITVKPPMQEVEDAYNQLKKVL